MNYLLDTNILLIYLREGRVRDYIEGVYNPFGVGNNPIISVVTIGEIRSILLRNNWGDRKIQRLEKTLDRLIITDINSEDVFAMYSEIDAFSQGKLKDKPLKNSSRNMGKNDLWIAATTQATNSILLSTDRDFDHLDNVYFKIGKIDLNRV